MNAMKKMLTSLLMVACPTLASSAVMNFEGIGNDQSSSTYFEDGITAFSGSGLAGIGDVEAAHLDDGGTGFAGRINFSMAQRFDAISFDLRSAGFHTWLAFDNGEEYFEPPTSVTYDNVLIEGFRSNTRVKEYIFDMGASSGTFSTYVLDGFTNLDKLSIGFTALPTADDFTPPSGFTTVFTCDSPCSHYNLDNVQLTLSSSPTPIPVPSAIILLFSGVTSLLVLRRTRKTATNV